MMRNINLIGFLLLQLLISSGCKKSLLDVAVFKGPQQPYDLAVEGGINTLYSHQYIRLSKPSVHPDSTPVPIRNASVIVNDSKFDIIFKETTPGVYVGTNRYDPNYNEAYKLTIKHNDKTYTATDTLRQVINIVDDFLPLSTHTTADQVIEGNIPKHTFGYINPNKWYISYQKIPLWTPSNFNQTKYYSYTHLLGSPNSLYPLNNLKREFSLGPNDALWIYKISLSDNYARYLYSVFMETDWSGLFSSVPTNISGNVSGNAQGYFSVIDVDRRRYTAGEL